jgi:large subunit ribosomal protein L21
MFAILETGSKQYKVEEGDVLEVELLNKEQVSKDNKVDFDSVLLVHDKELHIGQPFVKDAHIQATVLDEFKAPKVIVFKKKAKKQYKRTRGHRQQLHRIQIEKIEMTVAAPKAKAKPKAEPKASEDKAVEKAVETETKAKTTKKAAPKAAPKAAAKTAAKTAEAKPKATKPKATKTTAAKTTAAKAKTAKPKESKPEKKEKE